MIAPLSTTIDQSGRSSVPDRAWLRESPHETSFESYMRRQNASVVAAEIFLSEDGQMVMEN